MFEKIWGWLQDGPHVKKLGDVSDVKVQRDCIEFTVVEENKVLVFSVDRNEHTLTVEALL